MAHWRKSHQPASQFDALASWAVGASVLFGVLVLVARHVHI
jgi:hypothetical protein